MTERELIEKLNEYAYSYYVLDNPAVSDKEYDELYDRLLEIEKKEGRSLPGSPTQRVGGTLLSGFEKHRHLAPLWSLDKAQNIEELLAWSERTEKTIRDLGLPAPTYSLEYKFDGLTINLTYDKGYLMGAATRGDGYIGEEILEQIKTIRSIPLQIGFKGLMEVQGEAIMKLSVLEQYNKTADEPLKNARNAAAGALRNLDPAVTASRRLDAYIYNVGYIEGLEFADQPQMMKFLKSNKFNVSTFEKIYNDINDVKKTIDNVEESRLSLDFLIDGMVVKVNDFKTRAELAYTQKFPRWAVAYKFAAQEVSTIVNDVEWDVGRTGKLTPTALLEPVEIAGATVRRATLNNYEDILRKRVMLGARVFIRRSNDVIPEILGASPDQSGEKHVIEKPVYCPACGTELHEVGPNLYCPNSLSCRPQLVSRMAHFVSRDAMNIENLSEKTIAVIFDKLNIRDVAGIYSLTKEQLLGLEGFKEKRAGNIINAIERSKKPPLANFIYALGISNVGRKTSKDLAMRFGEFNAISTAEYDELVDIKDIGGVVAQDIVEFFASARYMKVIDELFAVGVEPQKEDSSGAQGLFSGKTFVLTGTLEGFTRKAAQKIIEDKGGRVNSSVSAKTDYLLAGSEAGSKLAKAQKLGVEIINENEFKRLADV